MTSIRLALRSGRIAAAAMALALGFAGSALAHPPDQSAAAGGSKGVQKPIAEAASASSSQAQLDPNHSAPTPDTGPEAAAQAVDFPARQVAISSGSATWDGGYEAMRASFAKIRTALNKAGVKEVGKPFSVFVETDDKGFHYDAMIPIEASPSTNAAPSPLAPDVKIGTSPSGKALKFEHRGAYNEIDATYEAITAYLDEKGLEAKDDFVEEYQTDTPDPDDKNLVVDIYIFIQ